MSMTLFKLAILFCLFDIFNVPHLGTFFDIVPCGVQFWFWALIVTGFIGLYRKRFGPWSDSDIYAKFVSMFPQYVREVSWWTPSGKNAIKVRLKDGTGLIFAYTDEYRWNLVSD